MFKAQGRVASTLIRGDGLGPSHPISIDVTSEGSSRPDLLLFFSIEQAVSLYQQLALVVMDHAPFKPVPQADGDDGNEDSVPEGLPSRED